MCAVSSDKDKMSAYFICTYPENEEYACQAYVQYFFITNSIVPYLFIASSKELPEAIYKIIVVLYQTPLRKFLSSTSSEYAHLLHCPNTLCISNYLPTGLWYIPITVVHNLAVNSLMIIGLCSTRQKQGPANNTYVTGFRKTDHIVTIDIARNTDLKYWSRHGLLVLDCSQARFAA